MPPDDKEIAWHSMPPDNKEIAWHSKPPDDIKLHGIQCHLMTKNCMAFKSKSFISNVHKTPWSLKYNSNTDQCMCIVLQYHTIIAFH
jgi:hypothetical protein